MSLYGHDQFSSIPPPLFHMIAVRHSIPFLWVICFRAIFLLFISVMAPNHAMVKFPMINRIYRTTVCFTWLYIRFLFLDVTKGGTGIAQRSPVWITVLAGAQLISPKLGWFFSPGKSWLCHFIPDTKLGTHFPPKPITHHLLTTVTISRNDFFFPVFEN